MSEAGPADRTKRPTARSSLYAANLLGALSVACGDLQRATLDRHGLDSGTATALLCVHARPGSTVGEIATTAGLTHSGAVRAASRLERLGLLRRRPADRRGRVQRGGKGFGAERARRAAAGSRDRVGAVERGRDRPIRGGRLKAARRHAARPHGRVADLPVLRARRLSRVRLPGRQRRTVRIAPHP
jgi:MarR family